MIYDDKKFIGKVIKQARKNANLNQAELCEKLGMSDKNLGNIENGRQFPQLNNFFRILEVLNLELNDFGVKNGIQKEAKSPVFADDSKDKLFKIILSANKNETKFYLKVLEFANSLIEDIKH